VSCRCWEEVRGDNPACDCSALLRPKMKDCSLRRVLYETARHVKKMAVRQIFALYFSVWPKIYPSTAV